LQDIKIQIESELSHHVQIQKEKLIATEVTLKVLVFSYYFKPLFEESKFIGRIQELERLVGRYQNVIIKQEKEIQKLNTKVGN
jgi:hypothetical protein